MYYILQCLLLFKRHRYLLTCCKPNPARIWRTTMCMRWLRKTITQKKHNIFIVSCNANFLTLFIYFDILNCKNLHYGVIFTVPQNSISTNSQPTSNFSLMLERVCHPVFLRIRMMKFIIGLGLEQRVVNT